jgi:hypothetical protein
LLDLLLALFPASSVKDCFGPIGFVEIGVKEQICTVGTQISISERQASSWHEKCAAKQVEIETHAIYVMYTAKELTTMILTLHFVCTASPLDGVVAVSEEFSLTGLKQTEHTSSPDRMCEPQHDAGRDFPDGVLNPFSIIAMTYSRIGVQECKQSDFWR